jgi:hypothetical protein
MEKLITNLRFNLLKSPTPWGYMSSSSLNHSGYHRLRIHFLFEKIMRYSWTII